MVIMSGGTRLFVGNIPKSCSEDELRKAFATYGEVINLDIKAKPADQDDANKFAFITLGGSHKDIESCIQNIPYGNFNGAKLHVTRARESFLERLQRERQQEQTRKENPQPLEPVTRNPVINLSEKLNPRKRKTDIAPENGHHSKHANSFHEEHISVFNSNHIKIKELTAEEKKKQQSELKRLESMKKKRQEFKQRQNIIKTGFISVDKAPNSKLVFSDNEDDAPRIKEHKKPVHTKLQTTALFEDDGSDDEVNFEIKKQYEGKKGQKVLELQSKFKSDKRFVLDERFVDDDSDIDVTPAVTRDVTDDVTGGDSGHVTAGERAAQLDILQRVLGREVGARPRPDQGGDKRKQKIKLGMPRFDPLQPSHAKFLAPVEESKEPKGKKKKSKEPPPSEVQAEANEVERVEASKEQFYKVSDSLKEAIAQPNTFSLRSLFAQSGGDDDVKDDKEATYRTEPAPSKAKQPRVRNPLEPAERNPFKYDSSESEDEEEVAPEAPAAAEGAEEAKVVWNEPFFFTSGDKRLADALEFFSTAPEDMQKERRELKSIMKKRLHNHERKDQMFKKKIGGRGRRKSVKKSYRKKS